MARALDHHELEPDTLVDKFLGSSWDFLEAHRPGLIRDKIERGIIRFLGKDQIVLDDGQETIAPIKSAESEQR